MLVSLLNGYDGRRPGCESVRRRIGRFALAYDEEGDVRGRAPNWYSIVGSVDDGRRSIPRRELAYWSSAMSSAERSNDSSGERRRWEMVPRDVVGLMGDLFPIDSLLGTTPPYPGDAILADRTGRGRMGEPWMEDVGGGDDSSGTVGLTLVNADSLDIPPYDDVPLEESDSVDVDLCTLLDELPDRSRELIALSLLCSSAAEEREVPSSRSITGSRRRVCPGSLIDTPIPTDSRRPYASASSPGHPP